MSKYTVIGYFVDNNQIWYEHVESETDDTDIISAIAAKQLKARNEGFTDFDDIAIVEVFEGELRGLSGNDTVILACDLL